MSASHLQGMVTPRSGVLDLHPARRRRGRVEIIRTSEPGRDRICVAAFASGANARAGCQQRSARGRTRALIWLLAAAVAALGAADALAAAHKPAPAHPGKTADASHKQGAAKDA